MSPVYRNQFGITDEAGLERLGASFPPQALRECLEQIEIDDHPRRMAEHACQILAVDVDGGLATDRGVDRPEQRRWDEDRLDPA